MAERSLILVVEDHRGEREALLRILRGRQYEVRTAGDAHSALDHVRDDVDLVISDIRMGATSGMDLLQEWKYRRPSTPFILMTAFGEVAVAVHAMKLGADEFLTKPFDPEQLLRLVDQSLNVSRRRENRVRLKNKAGKGLGFEKIVGCSEAMLEVCERLRRASLVDSTVLLTGESGTGKELFAEAIHFNSPRSDGPFITVNMAAVPESLVESELFGHAKGSFTGASESRVGKYEAAHGGTLFIDEIGDFAGPSQAKLLRVLENHRVTPVGSNEEREVDVRVVAATSRNLDEMVARGQFRADLYFRLDVIRLHIPPLRDRRDGIPLLIQHFLSQFSTLLDRPVPAVEPDLMEALINHDWPGNVRQLKNCLESMFVLAQSDVLRLRDLPISARNPSKRLPAEIPSGLPLYELERTAIQNALREHDGNRTHAARALRISVRTLQRKLKEFGDGAYCG